MNDEFENKVVALEATVTKNIKEKIESSEMFRGIPFTLEIDETEKEILCAIWKDTESEFLSDGWALDGKLYEMPNDKYELSVRLFPAEHLKDPIDDFAGPILIALALIALLIGYIAITTLSTSQNLLPPPAVEQQSPPP
ncbi:hypothetical protein [cf. Phormidesmis sp. LEGE 11477]|uniref:hypothetical protein n=1 Tax=cf. Phormidesmis sp. LEGE 11477 TaxID=1828680 RepID=UPI001880D5BC|nr:hypothetical protein [cf. Phormidesmis sp. LEGE 11477]MBE9064047.1 hypothetical protein [cf. Phormidesmis sp. LEGE 11477]